MLPRSPSLAATTMLFMILLLFLFQCAFAQQVGIDSELGSNDTQVVCRPFGVCEPCPGDALQEPFCQPFGNRRLMHCSPVPSTSSPGSSDFPGSASPMPIGETPAWESCGRIVEKERADFWEFVACNVVFAVIGVMVSLLRSKMIEINQARQLAARIGVVRGGR